MKNYQRILSGVIEETHEESPQPTPKKNEIMQRQAENREVLVGNNILVI